MISPLGSRYGIQGALGRSVKRASTASTWWDLNGTITSCVAAYQPKGAASYAASLTDLSGNSKDATEGTSPDWDSTDGWKFNGTDDYLKTGVTPASGWSAVVRYSNYPLVSDTAFIFGGYGGAAAQMRLGRSSRKWYYANGEANNTDSTARTSGICALAYNKVYFDGSELSGITTGTWSGTCQEIYLGCRNYNGAGFFSDVYIQAFAMYNAVLTSTQIGNLTTAMNAL